MSDIDEKLQALNLTKFDLPVLASHIVRVKGCTPREAANMLLDGEVDRATVIESYLEHLKTDSDTDTKNSQQETSTPD